VSGSPYLYVKQTDTTARNIWIDAVQLETGGTATAYRNGKLAVSGSVVINGGSSLAASSNTALQVRALGGGDGLHVIGNGENNVLQNLLVVSTGDGTPLMTINEGDRGTTIQGGNNFFQN